MPIDEPTSMITSAARMSETESTRVTSWSASQSISGSVRIGTAVGGARVGLQRERHIRVGLEALHQLENGVLAYAVLPLGDHEHDLDLALAIVRPGELGCEPAVQLEPLGRPAERAARLDRAGVDGGVDEVPAPLVLGV